MIDSMTAFAREHDTGTEGELTWEIRSVNHRYLEVIIRLPEEFRSLELLIREHIGQRLQRGKLDCTLRYQPSIEREAKTFVINTELVKKVNTAAKEVAIILGGGTMPTIMEIMQWPGILEEQPKNLDQLQSNAIALFDQTLENLAFTRHREGEKIEVMLRQRCHSMQEHIEAARLRLPKILEGIRERINAKLQEVLINFDPLRVEQEMVLLAQRLDIDEELDRLKAHLEEVERVLSKDRGVGRRLDFLMQELNRETNTIASKVNDVEVTHHAVEMKVLIEQMREQIQNIE
jgi:uncharacterized protein (TIGR00255 family)